MAALALRELETTGRGGDGPLRGLSLVIPSGVFTVATGPAGCGASTFVRVIAERQGDALRIDPGALVPRLSVYDNIALGLAKRSVAKPDVEARTLQAADAIDLAPMLARAVRSLSPEERWRVVFARALAHRPPLLLFDEPLAGVGPLLRMDLRRTFKRIQRETGATAVYATQDVADALALADVLVVMDDGRIRQSGAPVALYDAPADVAAARLSGPFGMNILPVRADQTGLSLEDGTTLGGASVRTGATQALLGVRPEHLAALGEGAPPPHGLSLPLVVEAVESTGADTLLHGRVGVHAVLARLACAPGVAPGATVRLSASHEHLHMFDAVSLMALPRSAAPRTLPPVAPKPVDQTAPIPPHLQRDPRNDDGERAQHERRLAAARARLSG